MIHRFADHAVKNVFNRFLRSATNIDKSIRKDFFVNNVFVTRGWIRDVLSRDKITCDEMSIGSSKTKAVDRDVMT